jgi:hypothetical protein
MGACEFWASVPAGRRIKTAADAFRAARDEALYEHGHGGYSGTIAEKHSFEVIDPHPFCGRGSVTIDDYDGKARVPRPRTIRTALPTAQEAAKVARFLFNTDDRRVSDKWGPASCVAYRAKGGRKVAGWLFFGLASE